MPAVVRKLRGSCKNFSLLRGAVVGKKPIDFLANPTHHQTSEPPRATLLLPINALFYIACLQLFSWLCLLHHKGVVRPPHPFSPSSTFAQSIFSPATICLPLSHLRLPESTNKGKLSSSEYLRREIRPNYPQHGLLHQRKVGFVRLASLFSWMHSLSTRMRPSWLIRQNKRGKEAWF